MISLSTCVFLLVFVPAAYGSTFAGPLINKTGALGTVRSACFIQELNLTIAVGGHVKSYDSCFYYDCMSSGFSGAGFGYHAGVMVIQGCTTMKKACMPYFVQDPQSSYTCMAAIPPTLPVPTSAEILHPPQCDDPDISDDLYEYMCTNGVSSLSLTLTAILTYTSIHLLHFFA